MKRLVLLASVALAGAVACKDRRYGDQREQVAGKPLDNPERESPVAQEPVTGGTTNAVTDEPVARDLPATPDNIAKRDIEDAQSKYGVNTATAEAIAHFNPAGTNKLRGVATIDGQALTVAVADAPPGKYLVELSKQPSCEPSKPMTGTAGSPANRTATRVPGFGEDRSGGAPDNLGFSGQGTFENAKGDHVLGFLMVGQDGQGRFEANISGELIATRDAMENQTIVIKTAEGEDLSRAELRSPIACGELTTAPAEERGA